MKNHRLIAFSFNVRVLCMQAYFIYILTVWCTQSIQKGIMKKCSTLCRIVIRDSSAGFFFLLIVQFCKHVWHNAEKSICQILLFSSFLLTSSRLFYPHPFSHLVKMHAMVLTLTVSAVFWLHMTDVQQSTRHQGKAPPWKACHGKYVHSSSNSNVKIGGFGRVYNTSFSR